MQTCNTIMTQKIVITHILCSTLAVDCGCPLRYHTKSTPLPHKSQYCSSVTNRKNVETETHHTACSKPHNATSKDYEYKDKKQHDILKSTMQKSNKTKKLAFEVRMTNTAFVSIPSPDPSYTKSTLRRR